MAGAFGASRLTIIVAIFCEVWGGFLGFCEEIRFIAMLKSFCGKFYVKNVDGRGCLKVFKQLFKSHLEVLGYSKRQICMTLLKLLNTMRGRRINVFSFVFLRKI
jgi:hypothetical protein